MEDGKLELEEFLATNIFTLELMVISLPFFYFYFHFVVNITNVLNVYIHS